MQIVNLIHADGRLSDAKIKEFAEQVLQKTGVSYIIGRPYSGKTEAAVRCMCRLARKEKVLFISAEDSPSSILDKMYRYCFSFHKNTDNLMFEIASLQRWSAAALYAEICRSDAKIVIVDGLNSESFDELSHYQLFLDHKNQNDLRIIFVVNAPRHWEYATFQYPHAPAKIVGYVE